MSISEEQEFERPFYFLTLGIAGTTERPRFFIRLRPSLDTAQHRYAETPVQSGRVYCLDLNLRFEPPTALTVAMLLNGREVWSHAGAASRSPERFKLFLFEPGREQGIFGSLALDAFSVTDRLPPPLPPRPLECRETLENWMATLSCAPFRTDHAGETQAATEWRLFLASDPSRPIFRAVDREAPLLTRRHVPFPLDSGGYFWQAAFLNQYGALGDFSPPRALRIDKPRPHPLTITRAYLSARGEKTPLAALLPGTWVNLHLEFDRTIPQGLVGYALANLHHPDFLDGHPGNKGGRFFSDRNYAYNFGFLDSSSRTWAMFEKYRDSSFETAPLNPDEQGRYMDAGRGRVTVDTVHNRIIFPVRILENARPGNWYLKAFMRDSSDRMSNLWHSRIPVLPMIDRKFVVSKRAWSSAGIVAVLLAIVLFKRSRRRVRDRRARENQRLFNQLTGYIQSNLNSDLSVQKVRMALGIGVIKFHGVLSSRNIPNLPFLVKQLRIEKAKTLLLETSGNISEIAFQVGFNDPYYFSKVFKEATGQTPSDFRFQSGRP